MLAKSKDSMFLWLRPNFKRNVLISKIIVEWREYTSKFAKRAMVYGLFIAVVTVAAFALSIALIENNKALA